MNVSSIIFIAILIILGLFLLWFFIFKVKHLKTPDVFCVDGGVKTGKSLVCVVLAIKQYKKNVFKTYVANFFIFIINLFRKKSNKKKYLDRPMLYSNMPLRCIKYNHLTMDIILRKVRIPYKSVVLIDEASLLADSMSGVYDKSKSKEAFDEMNEQLTLFIKLFGHYTHGGSLFYNSQQIIDLHFSFKRCTSTYLFVQKNRKFPFFCLLDVREMVHSEDGDAINSFNNDIDVDQKPLFILKKYYKYYDRYYLSCLTDHLQQYVDYNVVKAHKKEKLVVNEILTMGTYKSIKEFNKKRKELKQ